MWVSVSLHAVTTLIIIINDFIGPTRGLYELYKALRGPSECFLTPHVCPNENVTFHLYTNTNPTTPVELSVTKPESIRNAEFLPGPIKLIIHGYAGNKDYSPNMEIRPEYLKRPGNTNIISVDYGPIVVWGCYVESGKNAVAAANCTAQFLEHLLSIRKDIQLSQIHIVAYSLGAHVAGLIPRYFSLGQLERITALDVALPGFMFLWDHKELKLGDAKFIDALHTNGGMKGKLLPFADVDFYANGGSFQPPCDLTNTSCHHAFACELFAETINTSPNQFRACKFSFTDLVTGGQSNTDDCEWEAFGEYVSLEARGSYSFKTGDEAPYALRKNGMD